MVGPENFTFFFTFEVVVRRILLLVYLVDINIEIFFPLDIVHLNLSISLTNF